MSDANTMLSAAKLMAESVATLARIEGMKASNDIIKCEGGRPQYGMDDFYTEAQQLEHYRMHTLNYG